MKQKEEEIRRVAQKLDDAVENQDLETVLSCFSDAGEIEVFGIKFKGLHEIKSVINWMYQRFGKIKFYPLVIIVEENIFFEEFIFHTKFNGKDIEINAAELLEYENYKVTRLKLFLDRLEIAEAVSQGFIERQIMNWLNREILKGIPHYR